MANTIQGQMNQAGKAKFAILVGRFNSFVVDHLVTGALDTLARHGVSEAHITLIRLPGAWEMPVAAKKIASSGKYDAIIALGAVIRGGTPHFEFVTSECAKGLAAVSMESGLPIIFGVLTTDNIEQAIERAGTKAGNKGSDAALTAIEMVDLLKAL